MKIATHWAFAALLGGVACSVAAQQKVALYDFETQTLGSFHTTPNMASDITLTQPHMFWFEPTLQETLLCLPEEWNNDGTLGFTVTPAPGEPLRFSSFCFEGWKDVQTSPVSVNGATVFANGVQIASFVPLLPISVNCVDLSAIPMLQDVDQPVLFEVMFLGSSGHNSYEIKEISVEATVCVENVPDNWTFYIPNLPNSPDARWTQTDGSSFTERPDGTATLIGAIYNRANGCQRFSVQIDFSGRVDFGDPGFPPPNNPITTPFVDANLVSMPGGTIDLDTWHYYTASTATLTGKLCLDGAVVNVVGAGAAFQVGFGANLGTLEVGGSGWFLATTSSQPTDPAEALPAQFPFDGNMTFNDDCVCFGGVMAAASNYGSGLAGCNGVPTLTVSALPLIGTQFALQVGNAGAPVTNGTVLWSLAPDSIPLPMFGATLLVAVPIIGDLPFTTAGGMATVLCPVPDDACAVGAQAFAQAVLLDSCAPAGLSFSPGLELTIGDL